MKSYRELDNAILLLDTFCLFFQNKQNTRSDIYHFVSSSDGEATAESLYRELDNAVLLLDTIFYRKSLEVTVRELEKVNTLISELLSRKIREFFKLPIN